MTPSLLVARRIDALLTAWEENGGTRCVRAEVGYGNIKRAQSLMGLPPAEDVAWLRFQSIRASRDALLVSVWALEGMTDKAQVALALKVRDVLDERYLRAKARREAYYALYNALAIRGLGRALRAQKAPAARVWAQLQYMEAAARG